MQGVGVVVVDDLADAERQAISGLLGRRVTGDRVRVDLAVLDAKLRASPAATGVVGVVEALDGPVVDRRARRADATAAREQRLAAARHAARMAGFATEPWCETWLTSIRPIVARLRLADVERLCKQAAAVLVALGDVAASGGVLARNDLAVSVTGSAHGLDDGTPLAAVVLRALAFARDVEPPATAVARRTLWHEAGVRTDQVSTTVLALGLRTTGTGRRDAELRARADDAVETHLNARDLARITWTLPVGTVVHVCENPRVVEAAADAGMQAVLVCTMGNPTGVVLDLLDRLHAAGVRFRYHGDFDWPGVAIANRVIARVNAEPWRMSVADYTAAVEAFGGELVDLEGTPTTATWDASLRGAMLERGRAVHEELVLPQLVSDLA